MTKPEALTSDFVDSLKDFKITAFSISEVFNEKVFRGVQGVFTGQECKILPIEWTDEFNPIPVCGQIK